MFDILGFAEMAKDAQRAGTENEFLSRLYSALERGRNQCLEPEGWLEAQGIQSLRRLVPKDLSALKAFTDNIVIGWPILTDGEGELGQAFSALSSFQFEMIAAGFFIRGAISVGNIYIDDIAVVGGGLMEAHKGESSLARDPRVILTTSATNAVRAHLEYYGSRSGGGSHAPQNRELLQDADGQFFLNYLDGAVLIDDDRPGYEMMESHRAQVAEQLRRHRSQPTIWSKYAWVARYHNYFCELHETHFGEKYMIDARDFELSPSLIIDPRKKRPIPRISVPRRDGRFNRTDE